MLPIWAQVVLSKFGLMPNPEDMPGHMKPRKIPVRIEPKTYFANERTFLSWIQMAVTVATLSSVMMSLLTKKKAEGDDADEVGCWCCCTLGHKLQLVQQRCLLDLSQTNCRRGSPTGWRAS